MKTSVLISLWANTGRTREQPQNHGWNAE